MATDTSVKEQIGQYVQIGDLPLAAALIGDEIIEIVQLKDGVPKSFRLEVSSLKVIGEDGKSAYEVAQLAGFQGTEAEWLASLIGLSALEVVKQAHPEVDTPEKFAEFITGEKGKSAYEVAFANNPQVGTEVEWLASLIGDTGDKGETGEIGEQGPMGPGIKILGTLASEGDLPQVPGVNGEGYVINGEFWGWDGAKYTNMGPVQGPKGDRGPSGPMGAQGAKGEKGASILYGSEDPNIVSGRVGDMWINTATREYFQKTSSSVWTSLGHFGGGDVYSPSSDGKKKVRLHDAWVDLPVDEAPTTAGKVHGRKEGAWVEVKEGFDDAPKDGKTYLRKDNAWVEVKAADRADYKLNALVNATGATELDLALFNGFSIKNDVTGTKVVSMKNPPTGRIMTFPVTVIGNAGAFTWPDVSVWRWSGDKVPTFTAGETTLVVYWKGTKAVVSVGPSF